MERMAGETSRTEALQGGLGGHEFGVSVIYKWVENTLLPLRKRGRTVLSESVTFSDFTGVHNQGCIENRNRKNGTSLRYL